MQRSRWRFAPLVYAAAVYALGMATFGVGLLAAAVTFPLSLIHLRQVAAPRGLAFWIGTALNALLFAGTAYAVVAIGLS